MSHWLPIHAAKYMRLMLNLVYFDLRCESWICLNWKWRRKSKQQQKRRDLPTGVFTRHLSEWYVNNSVQWCRLRRFNFHLNRMNIFILYRFHHHFFSHPQFTISPTSTWFERFYFCTRRKFMRKHHAVIHLKRYAQRFDLKTKTHYVEHTVKWLIASEWSVTPIWVWEAKKNLQIDKITLFEIVSSERLFQLVSLTKLTMMLFENETCAGINKHHFRFCVIKFLWGSANWNR